MEVRLAAIAEGLTQDEPIERVSRETAAVAVVIRRGASGEEVLLIRRAERKGDPWSGHVAFPGGRVEAEDPSFRDAAAREAREEVGADLAAGARFLGYMGPFRTRRRGIRVVPAVFLLAGPVEVKPNSEVSSHAWVALQDLLGRRNRSTYSPVRGDDERRVPSFNIRGLQVWGLTERILSSLVESAEKACDQTTSRRTS
ncbi:MAG: CoA pyrophosphatase [Nitrososphaerales archaeon]